MKRILNVKRTSNSEVTEKWNMAGINLPFKGEIFIRCNKKGVVNWDKAPVFTLDRLLIRGNVKIINA